VGILLFSMFCSVVIFLCVWPRMVLNQRQVSVVSDWEPYFGSLFSIVFCGWLDPVLVLSPYGTVSVVYLYFCYFVQCSVDFIKYIIMDTYHAAHWSDPCYSSSDEEEFRYSK
jgi:hypothetical protein